MEPEKTTPEQRELFEEMLPKRKNEGRDELNFAEFPISAIYAPRGDGDEIKTLRYSDAIHDKSTGKLIEREVVITGSDAYGLPTATDEDVLLMLIQLSKEQDNFASPVVYFSRYELLNKLGWNLGGRNYKRLKLSLLRMTGTLISYETAWWNKEGMEWQSQGIHFIESFRLLDKKQADKDSRVKFGEELFKSLQDGNVKKLDLGIYFSLHAPIAKRLYRFLDKRFNQSKRWGRDYLQFDLIEFSNNKIGVARGCKPALIKQRLASAIKELETIGFLKQLPDNLRYRKVGKSKWNIVFVKGDGVKKSASDPQPQIELPAEEPGSKIELEMIALGVSKKVAATLAGKYPEEYLRDKLDAVRFAVKGGGYNAPKNPAGYLIKALAEDYAAPPGFVSAADRAEKARIAAAKKKRLGERARRIKANEQRQEARAEENQEKIRDYLSILSKKERAKIERQADDAASGSVPKPSMRGGAFWTAARNSWLEENLLPLIEPTIDEVDEMAI